MENDLEQRGDRAIRGNIYAEATHFSVGFAE